ncbi:YCII-related domain superfamily protein [Luminiphilus syltensis NOR5-1B]|uniref:YCII-related domain superfamily protein n=1 Tax=Luminiphilus syltensis NOR5-1B TaxID=565045 RepID=B8KVE4_9GAMM|nr:YCII-related domain superfamily protein [Luminiphilus syltensis NOR5-1B]
MRLETREAHLEYIKGFGEQLVMAGPFLDDADNMTGSLLILDFDDRVAAEAFCDNDPYARAGLFESVTINRWKKTLPA